MCIVTYLIEYLGIFEFIFETILDYESGDQMGSFDAKQNAIENLMLGHLSGVLLTLQNFYITVEC
jgi:hypothetical protein